LPPELFTQVTVRHLTLNLAKTLSLALPLTEQKKISLTEFGFLAFAL
jgi:hypothetical protein